MTYNFDEIIDRSGTASVKYKPSHLDNPLLPEHHIPMWIADMDFACPQPVLDAMHRRLDRQILGYTVDNDPAFLAAVSGWMLSRYGWETDPADIMHFPGVVAALDCFVELMTSEGDKVLMQPPVYGPFLRSTKRAGRTAVYNMLINDKGHYTVDFEDFERKVRDPAVKLFILCSPHNPTGRVWSKDELRRMADLCFANGVRIIADEIHSDLTRTGVRHTPLASLYGNDPRIVTCTAPSKTFNLAGNSQANIFVHDRELAAKVETAHPSPLSIEATRAAYTECAGWLDAMRGYLDGNLETLGSILRERLPQAVYAVPEGTYLAWVDLRATGLSHSEILAVSARDAGLYLQGGDFFVAGGEGFVRINCACPRSVLVTAAEQLCTAFAGY